MSDRLELNAASLESAAATLREATRDVAVSSSGAAEFIFHSVTGIAGAARGFLASIEAATAQLILEADAGTHAVHMLSHEASASDRQIANALVEGFAHGNSRGHA